MPAHHAAALHQHRRARRATWRGFDNDDPFYRRRILGIGCEISPMTSLPALNWPVDLFVDARAPEVESTI
jgi:hypothetical protein